MTDPKHVARKFYQVIDATSTGQADIAVLDDVLADHFQAYQPGGESLDREGFKGMRQVFTVAFPGATHTIEDMLAEGNRVAMRVTWHGKHRKQLDDAGVWPRPVQDRLPIWIAVGGTPESVVRAAALGLPLTLAIIGGETARFRPFVDLYRHTWEETGQTGEPRIAINTHAFVAPSRLDADAAFASSYLALLNRIGRERGWPPSGRTEYEALASPSGPLAIGSPDEVAAKIVSFREMFRPERYLAHISIGAVSHRDVMRAIELFGTEVAPLVEREITVGGTASVRRSA